MNSRQLIRLHPRMVVAAALLFLFVLPGQARAQEFIAPYGYPLPPPPPGMAPAEDEIIGEPDNNMDPDDVDEPIELPRKQGALRPYDEPAASMPTRRKTHSMKPMPSVGIPTRMKRTYFDSVHREPAPRQPAHPGHDSRHAGRPAGDGSRHGPTSAAKPALGDVPFTPKASLAPLAPQAAPPATAAPKGEDGRVHTTPIADETIRNEASRKSNLDQ